MSCHDRVMWSYDHCGDYNVMSRYHIARKWKNLSSDASSSVSTRQ